MSRTGAGTAAMAAVSGLEQPSLTCSQGGVSFCDGHTAVCMMPEEFCPMTEILREKDRALGRQDAELAEARRQVLHLGGLAKLGELSAVVAHEIRNPLTGISATAEVLMDDMADDDLRRESVSTILDEIHRLDKTVRNLLDFARDHKPFLTRVDLRGVVERVVSNVRHEAAERGVQISGSCSDDLPPAVADPELLGQALMNITLNGIQAMSGGGELRVSLRCARGGGSISVCIDDNGCGIDPQHLERIFDPFFTTKASGAGLGLAVSKKIIEAQHGSIRVRSRKGAGTTFVVELPAAH